MPKRAVCNHLLHMCGILVLARITLHIFAYIFVFAAIHLPRLNESTINVHSCIVYAVHTCFIGFFLFVFSSSSFSFWHLQMCNGFLPFIGNCIKISGRPQTVDFDLHFIFTFFFLLLRNANRLTAPVRIQLKMTRSI